MDIRFLNEKKMYSVRFKCLITDRRNMEESEMDICWLEPDCSEYCEKHAWCKIVSACENLGYDIQRADDKPTWKKVVLNKSNLYNAGEPITDGIQ